MTVNLDEPIRRPILIQLSAVFLLLLSLVLFGLYLLNENHISQHVRLKAAEMEPLIAARLDEAAEEMATLLERYGWDKGIRQAFLEGDRESLGRRVAALRETILKKNHLSHLSFITSDREVFLTVGKPWRANAFGPGVILNRASANGGIEYGLELGKEGNLSLRVVKSWHIEGLPVGYLEAGRDIDEIAENIKDILDIDLVFWMEQDIFPPAGSETAGRYRSGADERGESPSQTIIATTLTPLPGKLLQHMLDLPRSRGEICDVSLGPSRYRGTCLPLRDAASRDIGNIFVLLDVTHDVELLRALIVSLLSGSVFFFGTLLFFFSGFLGRIESRLAAGHTELLGEIAARKEKEQALREAHDLLEHKVGERTAELARTVEEKERQIQERLRVEKIISREHDLQSVVSTLLTVALKEAPLDVILKQALDLILDIPWLTLEQRGAIFLVEGTPDNPDIPENLVMKVQNGLAAEVRRSCGRLEFGKCLCGRAALTREPVFASHADDCHEVRYEGMEDHGHYCIPILFEEKVLGVLNLYLRAGHSLVQREVDFLTAIANTLAGILVRRRAVEAVRAAEERYRAITATVLDAIIMMDDRGRIIFWNRAAEEIFGYGEQEVMGRDLHQLLAPHRHHEKAVAAAREFARSGRGAGVGRTVETEGLRRDGTEFPMELSIGRLKAGEGRFHAVGVVRDITVRREAEAEKEMLHMQFLQAQKMEAVGQLAGGVAHDFNNLLTGIIGFSDLTLETLEPGTAQHQDLTEVIKLAGKAANVVRQLLAFSRRQTIEPVVLNLNDLITNLTKMLRRLIGEDIEFEFSPAENSGLVMADPGQLEQVLVNLVVNARHAMPGVGRLFIETGNTVLDLERAKLHGSNVAPGAYVMLSVTDTGCGMDKAVREHIFDPFFTTKKEGEGTGLGLSTVYGIIKQHQGHIWVYSEKGLGTTFKIYLPMVEQAAAGKKNSGETKPEPGGTETILVVEDDAEVGAISQRFLQQLGYKVFLVTEVADAEDILARERVVVDLMLIDVVMPKMDGPTLYDRCLALRPELKALFMSGYPHQILARRGMKMPETPLIAKPFSKHALALKVREALDDRA